MWKACLTALFLGPALMGQVPADLFEKAPPHIDEALRERITEFYRLHIDGKFRQAEALVAEDSKDFFYASQKPKLLKCEITRIEYSEEFTRAKAVMACDRFIPMVGFSDKPLTVPFASMWKSIEGQWFWFVPAEALRQTPFGERKMDPSAPAAAAAAPPPMPKSFDLATIMNQVKADKNAVRLRAEENSSDQVHIVNQMPGPVTLKLRAPEIPGVEVKLESRQLKAGEKVAVTFRREPGAKPPAAPVKVYVDVEQTGAQIPIEVSFDN